MPDQSSFDAFYATTRDRLFRQLTVMTADPEQAQDALQEAYSRAWQRWTRVSRMDDPAAWVRTVAWRVAVSHHRSRRRPRARLPSSTPRRAGCCNGIRSATQPGREPVGDRCRGRRA